MNALEWTVVVLYSVTGILLALSVDRALQKWGKWKKFMKERFGEEEEKE